MMVAKGKQWQRQLEKKLASIEGFMLGEQLISIIFIGLLCIALSAGLSAALTVFGNVSAKTQAQSLLNRAVDQVGDELVFSHIEEDTPTNFFVSDSMYAEVQLVNAPDQAGIALQGDGITTGVSSNEGEWVLLVSAADDLVPRFAENQTPVYQPDTDTWTFTIEVVSRNARDDAAPLSRSQMTVVRVGQ